MKRNQSASSSKPLPALLITTSARDHAESFFHLWKTLNTDVTAAHDELQRGSTPYKRRAFVRAVVSFIEGVVFGLKQIALAAKEVTLDRSEIALLAEEQYDLSDSGEPVVRSNFTNLTKNMRFTFAVYAKAHGTTYPLPVSSYHWESMRRTIAVRNRLAHPKRADDL